MNNNNRKTHSRLHLRNRKSAATTATANTINKSEIATISYGLENYQIYESIDIDTIRTLRHEDPPTVLWVHVTGLGGRELIQSLGREFELHRLALEDVVEVHQQVKVEDYSEYLFIVSRILTDPTISQTQQFAMFLGANFVVSFEEKPSPLFASIQKRLGDGHSQIRQHGPDFLAYVILDIIVDQYFPLLEQYGERLDDLEDEITDHPPRGLVHRVHNARGEMRSIRRIIWQQRELLSQLRHNETHLITESTRLYLRDCHDHTVQLVELLEIFHETCSDLRDVYLSAISNRMNEIMMVLTIIATIFIPMSFVTGLYGMNFNTRKSAFNMPELNWYLGYPFALGLMAAIAFGLLGFFYHRGWIGRSD